MVSLPPSSAGASWPEGEGCRRGSDGTGMAEQAALMAEALADVELATTIATADADNSNSRQQTTINNRLGQAVSGGGSDRGGVRGSGGASSGLELWGGEAADRTMTMVETATEAVAAMTATEEAVAEAAAVQQQQRCHGGGGGGRLGGRGDAGNSSGGCNKGSGGNRGSG